MEIKSNFKKSNIPIHNPQGALPPLPPNANNKSKESKKKRKKNSLIKLIFSCNNYYCKNQKDFENIYLYIK